MLTFRGLPCQEPTVRQSNGALYKQIMGIKNEENVTTVQKRPGRPRKLPRNPIADATDVIYLSNAKSKGPPKHFPLKLRGRPIRCRGVGRTPAIANTNCLQVTRCAVYPSATTLASHQCKPLKSPATTLSRTTPLPCTTLLPSTSKQVVKDNWPEDLRELVNSWDSLSESQLREVVKWFQTPLHLEQNLPQIIRNIHASVSELFSPFSNERVDEYNALLVTEIVPKKKPQPKIICVAAPKVVVESQPSSLQNYCQWSSMVANQEFRES